MKKYVKLDENYFLISQKMSSNDTVELTKSVNHIISIDVSGSMTHDLQLIRTQLKNKLSNLVKGDNDTVSIVWFSGNNEAGILKEEVQVNSLKQLNDLNEAIDRYLRPIGLTAFHKPLVLVKELIGRIRANRPDSLFNLLFLTDGYNNNCNWRDVISALKNIESDLASSTFIEYGYYCNSESITEMASTVGGSKISASSFIEYEPIFDSSISKSIRGGKKTLVEITDKYLYDFVFSVDGGSVLLYNIVDGKVMVGGDVKEIYFFSPKEVGVANNGTDTALYAAIYVLSDKLLNDDAEKVFYALGDNHYYRMLVNAFGKQKLNGFKTAIKECIADVSKRFPDGGRAKITPVSDSAYCFMNLIEDLGNIEDCLFFPNHSDFSYNRIGRKKVAVGSTLTDADKQRLAEAKNIEELNKITAELAEKKIDLEFVNSNYDKGYPLTDIVWNEERANLSVRTYIDGEAILPENKFGIDKVASFRYKTYTLVKDGIVNVQKLPVSDSKELYNLLSINKVNFDLKVSEDGKTRYIIIDLTSIPLVNRGMVKAVSAKSLAIAEWNLLKLQADKKVYDYYRKSLFPKTSKSFVEMLGQEVADWLKEIGITDYNGFAPKTTDEESTDFYMSVHLATKVKGFSSLPKVEDVVTKLKDGKPLKPSEWIMSDAVKKYQSQLESEIYQTLSEEQQKDVLKTYLETKSAESNKTKRKAMQEIAEIKFALILSKKWFTEFKSFDENTLTLNLDGQDLFFTFDLSEKEEKI